MSSPVSASLLPKPSQDNVVPTPASTQVEDFAQSSPTSQAPRLPTLRNTNDSAASPNTNTSSNPLGALNAARRPGFPQSSQSSARTAALPQDMQAKMRAFHLSRQGAPPPQVLRIPPNPPSHSTSDMRMPFPTVQVPSEDLGHSGVNSSEGNLVGGDATQGLAIGARPPAPNFNSAPAVPNVKMNPKMGLAAKRGLNRGMKLSDATGTSKSSAPDEGAGTNKQETSSTTGGAASVNSTLSSDGGTSNSLFTKFSEFVDTKTGTLKFKGKATIHGKGIDFSTGTSFSISLDEVDSLEELGKGNYGTVYKIRHSRPQMRRPGLGLNSQKHALPQTPTSITAKESEVGGFANSMANSSTPARHTTGMVMAMKEIRLELDEAKFAAIIMELDVLHRCISPFIIDFYGAFFQEGAVYICMEFMDGGSIDKLYGDGIPEGVLRKITMSTVMGLKALKDDHNIIHRDVKPTNILVNSRGQVKICDFGVSGNLVASIAKTNIGCQSYMAPERIASGGIAQSGANPGGGTYSVQSDIWSLGLSIIECAMGQYPYPPETYNNIFSQLSVSVPLFLVLLISLLTTLGHRGR